MFDLPAALSEQSQSRIELARRLVESCPNSMAGEIAVTGSAARGVADEYSDIELNLWGEQCPEAEAWRRWLEGAGATDIHSKSNEPEAWNFASVVCKMEDIWVEMGWAPIEAFNTFVGELAAGRFVGHERLQMAWTVQQAFPLRSAGQLARWKALLSTYPDGLAERVVADQTEVWSDPHVPGVRWGLAARGERMGLALRFIWDMQNLLRVLFAVNHLWDRDLKWTDDRSLDLPIKPANLSARINATFTLTNLPRAVEIEQQLIVETLELASANGFTVDAAFTSMREGLQVGLESSR